MRNLGDTQDETALKFGSSYLIKWNTTGKFTPSDNVSIWYSVDGGGYSQQISSSTSRSAGQFVWPSVPIPLSDTVVIRVADVNDILTNGLVRCNLT